MDHEFPAPSVEFLPYDTYRAGSMWIPQQVWDCDIVHIHSLFTLGASGIVLAEATGCPLVVSYHTPINKYSEYLVRSSLLSRGIQRLLRWQEEVLLERADHIVCPSESTRTYLRTELGVSTPVEVISNGVDIEFFSARGKSAFRDRYELSGPLIGYTGRHGQEKQLATIIQAAERMEMDVTIVFGGDGPARGELERTARMSSVEIKFLGFLPREELPSFYSAMDVFAFPSPVETEGLVALESMACGTPVVGVDANALPQTIDHGVTGYVFEEGSESNFADALEKALSDREQLRQNCLDYRNELSIVGSVTKLSDLYNALLS